MKRYSLFYLPVLILLFSLNLYGYPSGISGRTLKGSTPGCTCHTSSTSSNVTLTISGPNTLTAGQTADYQVVTTYTSTITGAGIDIAASNGTLANKDSHLKILNGELTHPSAQTGTTSLTWHFSYTAPSTPGTETLYATGCAIKVQWNHAANFTITIAPAASLVTLTSPAGGENWIAGSTHDITWTSTNVSNINLEYTTDNGTSWNVISDSVAASAGLYSWTLPAVSSSQCKVKITDLSNSATSSTSLPFTISPASSVMNISQIRMNDANGVSLDTGMVVTISGIISVGNEFNSPSYIQDNTAGIAVYGRGSGYFSSMVKIGDSVTVTGKVTDYRGLTEFNPVTSFTKLDSGKTIEAQVVTISDIKNQSWNGFEAYEGSLLRLNGVKLVSPVSTFAGNTNYYIYSGSDTTQIRIANGTNLVGQSAPSGTFNIVGVLSQYKTSAPYSSGYQLLPRFTSDITTVTSVQDNNNSPLSYQLLQNYPNPFNPSTEISFTVKENEFVTLKVYNVIGEEIAALVNGVISAGKHTIEFNAKGLNSGIYFYTLKAGNNAPITRKMVLLK